jgi:hypothetical protein
MAFESRPCPATQTAAHYTIRVHGYVTPECEERLAGMHATVVDDEGRMPTAVISGPLPDQVALAGVLIGLHEYGLLLVSLQRSELSNAID